MSDHEAMNRLAIRGIKISDGIHYGASGYTISPAETGRQTMLSLIYTTVPKVHGSLSRTYKLSIGMMYEYMRAIIGIMKFEETTKFIEIYYLKGPEEFVKQILGNYGRRGQPIKRNLRLSRGSNKDS